MLYVVHYTCANLMFLVLYIICTQLYERRKKMLRNTKEKERFQNIDYSFMTEESMSKSDDIVRKHKLPWHSEGEVKY